MNKQAVLPVVNLLREILSGYCKYPQDLSVELQQDKIHEQIANIVVMPHQVDYPRMIGKAGRFVNAFMGIVTALGEFRGQEIKLVLKDTPKKGRPENPSMVPFNPNYDIRVPWNHIHNLLVLAGATEVKGKILPSGEAKDYEITLNSPRTFDHEFFANIATIFTGFGHFQGIGKVRVQILQEIGRRGSLEGGERLVLGTPEGKEGLA